MMLCLDQGCPILLLEGQHPEHFSLPFTTQFAVSCYPCKADMT